MQALTRVLTTILSLSLLGGMLLHGVLVLWWGDSPWPLTLVPNWLGQFALASLVLGFLVLMLSSKLRLAACALIAYGAGLLGYVAASTNWQSGEAWLADFDERDQESSVTAYYQNLGAGFDLAHIADRAAVLGRLKPQLFLFEEVSARRVALMSGQLGVEPLVADYHAGGWGCAIYWLGEEPARGWVEPMAETSLCRAEIRGATGPVHIWLAHPLPPISPASSARQNLYLEDLAKSWRGSDAAHKIVAGDFNMSDYHPKFRETLGGLDSQRFYSWGYYWSRFLPLTMPIDYVLATQRLEQIRLPRHGSDHHAIGFRIPGDWFR